MMQTPQLGRQVISSNSALRAQESDPFRAAMAEWEQALGARNVDASSATCDRYARTTGVHGTRALAVISPASTAEVARVMEVASAHQIGVYPISKGKNWGYGDACPMRNGQVILDLSRMNRILEVNTELKYAVIEPGVTQGQLHGYLSDNHTGLWLDSSGAGRDASVLGNALERGFGHTRYGDHFLTTCGMQVVLADGRVLNTGYGHYGNAQAHRAYRYGVGPFIDGLFSQSNYGVVTQMGIWLMPEPEDFAGFFLASPDPRSLPDLVAKLVGLRMQGLLQSTVHIGNDLRAISGRMSYPWDRAAGKTPLPTELRAQLRQECNIGAWNACGAIYGTRETVAATWKVVRRVLADFQPILLNDRKLRLAGRIHGALSRFGLAQAMGKKLEIVQPVYGLLKGIPTNETLRGAAWRVRGTPSPAPQDPLDCNAGLMWAAPIVPATGHHAREVMDLIEPIYEKHGFEALVTFTLITERALCCVTNVAFDRRESDESARAEACYHELTDTLARAGYLPYRCGPAGMPKLSANSNVFWDVATQIKRALDPQGIISPGRYLPAA